MGKWLANNESRIEKNRQEETERKRREKQEQINKIQNLNIAILAEFSTVFCV